MHTHENVTMKTNKGTEHFDFYYVSPSYSVSLMKHFPKWPSSENFFLRNLRSLANIYIFILFMEKFTGQKFRYKSINDSENRSMEQDPE